MRGLALICMLALAAPAAAQPYRDLAWARDGQAAADAQAARNRDVTLTNDLAVLQAQVQSDRALANLQAARGAPVVPTVALGPNATPPVIDVSKLASIPDATLAKSNAAVRAAADNRR
jgi:hypothetical protein